MDIEEIINKKKELEIQIQDSINAFMKDTKVIIDGIDIRVEVIHLELDGLHEIKEISLSIKL